MNRYDEAIKNLIENNFKLFHSDGLFYVNHTIQKQESPRDMTSSIIVTFVFSFIDDVESRMILRIEKGNFELLLMDKKTKIFEIMLHFKIVENQSIADKVPKNIKQTTIFLKNVYEIIDRGAQ